MRRLSRTLSALTKKGFSKRDGRDWNLRYVTEAGMTSSVFTRVPKGDGDLKPHEFRGIRKDLSLSERELCELIDCPMSQETLEALLASRGRI